MRSRILGQSLLIAVGMIGATLVAVLAPVHGRSPLWGAALMAVTMIGADMLLSPLRGRAFVPSWCCLLLTASFLAACGLLALAGSSHIAPMIPVLGGSASWPILYDAARSGACRGVR